VLIANDQEWSARSIESVLAPQGFAILRAFTGQQAIDRALSARPDLILLDAQLPDIHGFDVCRRLRESPTIGHSVPIIITTAGPSGRQQRLEASPLFVGESVAPHASVGSRDGLPSNRRS